METNQRTSTSLEERKAQIREIAENDLGSFIRLVHPGRVLGSVHDELISWWNRDDAKSHQLVLLPRDHQKSALLAYRVAWTITRNPAIRILYISATTNLANKQLKFIKDILTCDIYRYYWPEMVNVDESKREKWTESEISVDHPLRKAENVRDPTIFTAGLTTTITGMHCDIACLDDVVIEENAYEAQGREKVKTQISYLASIQSAEGLVWACGTRYGPNDYYGDMLSMVIDIFDEHGEIIDSEPLYELFERQVESNGDGTGEFLWARMQRPDGKWFGFNREILAKKKAQYSDLAKFRAQYYNNPNDISTANINKGSFQYYDRLKLKYNDSDGRWYFNESKLNVFAAVDFAYSLSKLADYTAIVVIGVDHKQNIYILEIDRFKTKKISDYFDRILRLHHKWGFRKIRAETSAAQSLIVEDLKNNYVRPNGIALSIDGNRPVKNKEERIEAALQHRYENKFIWHYVGGNCDLLEEELMMQRPSHDDIKDALASVVEIAVAPSFMGMGHTRQDQSTKIQKLYNTRFGGIG